jgi:methylated-DNA-protein-cysteine methyltransferase related protein
MILSMGRSGRDAPDLSEFDRAVKRVVGAIPRGTVLAYGEVALLAGRPGGARAVVRALNRIAGVPWWRVVRADRTLAPEVATRQAKHLRTEGLRVEGRRIVVSPKQTPRRLRAGASTGKRRGRAGP